MESMKINCPECNKELHSFESLRKHRSMAHKVPSEQTYIDFKLNGIIPTCKCGCGEPTKFLGFELGYREYKLGHASRVNNNWGHNPDAIRKSHETQKKMYDSGELKIWNKGLDVTDERVKDNIEKVMSNPNRGSNISKALLGVKKSESHKNKFKTTAKKRWANINERNKQRFRRLDYFKNRQFNKKTVLEAYFESILTELGIKFESQHPINGYLFDIYIKDKNVLIEVDGDWYHCNPSVHPEAKSIIQKQVINNDVRKNKIAADNDYKLLRFWESDINHNPEQVIITLKKELGL